MLRSHQSLEAQIRRIARQEIRRAEARRRAQGRRRSQALMAAFVSGGLLCALQQQRKKLKPDSVPSEATD